MKQKAWLRRVLAGMLGCLAAFAILFSASAAPKYPYETICEENVNMRKTASGSAVIVKRITAGETITIEGETKDYYQVKYGGVTGYAVKQYVDGTSTGAEVPPVVYGYQPPMAITEYPYDTNTVERVKFRKTASDTAVILSLIPKDAIVTVQGLEENGYAKIRYDSKTGYVNSGFLNLANIPGPTAVPTPTPDPAAEKYTMLAIGDSGAAVRALQEALTELTYYKGPIDEKYGPSTVEAVNAFKKKNKLTEDGIADAAMQLFMYEGTPKNPQGYRKIIKTLPPLGDVVIKEGKQGLQVEKLQARLKELGYYLGEVTGICDKATVTGIKDFQTKHFLKKTGIADVEMQSILYGASAFSASMVLTPSPAPTAVPPKDTVRQGDKTDDARSVQQRLQELGYYKGKITGTFNTASVKALKEFQEKHGLNPDGVCGEQSRKALWKDDVIYAVPTAIPIVEALPTLPPITPENVVMIQAGARGNAVLNLQVRLTDLGYYVSRQDGVCLEDDISAIRAFQRANGLKVDGKAGYETQVLAYSDTAVRGSIVAVTATVRYGDEGDSVVTLQNRLKELEYLETEADGKFGMATKTALMDFQRASGLPKDGVAGPLTQTKIYGADAKKNPINTSLVLKQGTASSAVKDLQSRLISLGFLKGSADGKFGAKTNLALIAFQKKNNLTADGVAGKATLEKINSTAVQGTVAAVPTPKPMAVNLTGAPSPSSVIYANWYTDIRSRVRQMPNVTIYDFMTGISWQVNLFSLGAHADGEPITANDTANMNRAFGGKTTWNPKPVWVVLSDGTVYLASTHNTPHDTQHKSGNDFAGHLCVHFPRTKAQVEAIGPYATSHQKAIDLAWEAILKLRNKTIY